MCVSEEQLTISIVACTHYATFSYEPTEVENRSILVPLPTLFYALFQFYY